MAVLANGAGNLPRKSLDNHRVSLTESTPWVVPGNWPRSCPRQDSNLILDPDELAWQ